TTEYPWPFFGYRKLPGKEACDSRLDHAQRSHLAKPIARFLPDLHKSPNFITHDELPLDLRRIESVERLSWGKHRLEDLRSLGENLPYAALHRCLPLPSGPRHSPIAPVHGDLHFRHLLLDGVGELSGVIDWGKFH